MSPLAPASEGPFVTDSRGLHLVMRLQAWGELLVRVLDAACVPARGVMVRTEMEQGLGGGWAGDEPDADGRFVLRHCAPGKHRLMVRREDGRAAEREVHISPGHNSEVVVMLPAASSATKR